MLYRAEQRRQNERSDADRDADHYLILFRHHRRAGRVGAYFGANGVMLSS